jgi:hypothetical protein
MAGAFVTHFSAEKDARFYSVPYYSYARCAMQDVDPDRWIKKTRKLEVHFTGMIIFRVVDPEFISDPTPDPDPTFKEVSALTPDPVSDPATLVSASLSFLEKFVRNFFIFLF